MDEIPEIIGVSKNIVYVKHLVNQIADIEPATIVCGETGVGKDLIVQTLYLKSNRYGKPFIKINCAALPDSLLESEMFGYEKGAFTGAVSNKRGKFELANGGVLFLDEVGDMSFPLQAKLLRVLQDGEFTPLGSEKTVETNVWVIAATNHDLEENIKTGKFRADLFYRLSTILIHIEPLRKRSVDIPLLIKHYYKKYASLYKDRQLKMLSEYTLDKLKTYSWPGNVRELQNVLQRILIINVNSENIDDILNNESYESPSEESPNLRRVPELDWDIKHKNFSMPLKKISQKIRARIDKKIVTYVLEKTNWNRKKASKILGISYRSILSKIQDLGIETKPKKNRQALEDIDLGFNDYLEIDHNRGVLPSRVNKAIDTKRAKNHVKKTYTTKPEKLYLD
jgi:transcriptional regulator with GAF, ATPase, and Fis domain